MGLCCGFRWEGGDNRKSRLSGFRGPRHLLLPPSREEIFRAPVVLKGGGPEETKHSGSDEDRAELPLNSSRMLFLGTLPHQTPEQTAFPATNSHKPLATSRGIPEWVVLGGTTGPGAGISVVLPMCGCNEEGTLGPGGLSLLCSCLEGPEMASWRGEEASYPTVWRSCSAAPSLPARSRLLTAGCRSG